MARALSLPHLASLVLAASLVSLAPAAGAAPSVPGAEAPFVVARQAQDAGFRLVPGTAPAQRIELGEVDAVAIAAVKRANADRIAKRLQIGIPRKIPAEAPAQGANLHWERVPGGVAAHWEVVSRGAKALRIRMDGRGLAAHVELRFAGSGDPGTVHGPLRFDDPARTDWSPVLEGEAATVEVFVADAGIPAGAAAGEVASLAIGAVSHLFVNPRAADAEALAKAAEFCEVDLVCRSATDPALASVGRAVAKMVITRSDGSYLCTGTLLNSSNGPVAPYFYTAAHCVSTQEEAATIATHWFYDRTGCGTGGTSASFTQVAGGATLLYANPASDAALLRLNQNPPAAAFYAGWDASTVAVGTALTGVHHPDGDLKKVSLATARGFGIPEPGYASHLIAGWNAIATGVVEPGSSGSGIFTAVGQPATQYLLRGGLFGGPSSCTAPADALYDFYSRFDQAYTCIAQHLSPVAGCTYGVSTASQSVGAGTATGSLTVSAGAACAWGAMSQASWITTTSCGSGSGAVTYTVAANPDTTSRTGTLTVGGQTVTITQAGQPGTNVVVNGGFESGSSGWTESATSGLPIITTGSGNAHSGNGYAWLGGYDAGADTLHQDVTIPAGASPVTLSFWYRIRTEETSTAVAYDFLRVQVQSPATGAILATLATYSNLGATSGWTQSAAFDLSAFAGQTVRLRFAATMDESAITSFLVDDIALIAVSATPVNYTALWWNPAESGWGINLNHQGNIVFGTLFTYDASGAPLWLVMPAGALVTGSNTYGGDLYRTTGPPFNANPFTPIGPENLVRVGGMTVAFTGPDTATLGYTVNGVAVTKSIQKQVFGARAAGCTPTTASRAGAANYQDLWWNPAESGWGVNVTHQDDTLFATLFTYDAAGRGLWLVMSAGRKQADGSYLGELYRTSGPPFDASPFPPIGPGNLTTVGTMRFTFRDGENGTLGYTYEGVPVTKAITRQVFSSPVPLCAS